MKKKICILGSTGSIGISTLEILSKDKKNFEVILLSANQNFKLLLKQAKVFKPKYIYANNIFLENKIKYFCKKNKIVIINDLNSLKKLNLILLYLLFRVLLVCYQILILLNFLEKF